MINRIGVRCSYRVWWTSEEEIIDDLKLYIMIILLQVICWSKSRTLVGTNDVRIEISWKQFVFLIEQFIFSLILFSIGFLRCCGSCPFASLLAFLLTLTGTGICCGCLYYSVQETIEHINTVFEIEYIDRDW